MSNSTPRADALRAMREAKYDLNVKRMKEEQGRTVDRPKAVATKKTARKAKGKIDRTRGNS